MIFFSTGKLRKKSCFGPIKRFFSVLAYTVRTMDVTEERLVFLGMNFNVHIKAVLENAFKIFQKIHLTKLSPSD